MTRETFTITDKQHARDIIFGDDEEFNVIEDKIINKARWNVHHRVIVKRSDGKFFAARYSCAATEYQDERPFEYDDADFVEVFEREKTIIVYE